LRLLTIALLIALVGIGAGIAGRSATFDDIQNSLERASDEIDGGLLAPRPTPVAIPRATPGWDFSVSSADTLR
jgi:hypothetical protein